MRVLRGMGLMLALAGTLATAAAAETTAEQYYTKQADGAFVPVALATNASGGPILSGAFMDLLTTMTTWSNIAIAPYGIYDTGTKSEGVGVLALYNLNRYTAGGIALQYLNGEIWMPSAQLQLQAPLTIGGKVTVTPLAFTGIGTPISSDADHNGGVTGIFGAGLGVKITSHLDAFFALAKWTGFEGEQWYFGLAWKF